MVTVEKARSGEYDTLAPAKPAGKPLEDWKLEALTLLQRGEDVRIRFSDSKEKRGLRLAIARLASTRLDIKTAARDGQDETGPFLIMRKIGDIDRSAEEAPSATPKTRRSGKSKSES